jgi:hypothetical protein
MEKDMRLTFYHDNRKRFLKIINFMLKRVDSILIDKFGRGKISYLKEEIKNEFTVLNDDLPYIGGFANDHIWYQFIAVTLLSVHNVLKKQGCSTEESGRMVYQMVDTFITSFPRWLVRLWGHIFFRIYFRRLNRQSADSLTYEYPYNWVFYFIKGNGREYDCGVDYHRCFIHEYFVERNASDLVPYMCALDYVVSEAFGWGLIRTRTIQGGDHVCSFRYKKGGVTKPVLHGGVYSKRIKKRGKNDGCIQRI